MRYILFIFSALLLLLLLLLAWTFRYEQAGSGKLWTLADMRPLAGDLFLTEANRTGQQETLSAQTEEGDPNRFMVLELPGCGKVDALHVRYRILCDDLVPGDASWHKGRIAIQWLADAESDGGENDPVHDFSGDGVIKITSRVVAPTHAPAIPRIMLQHLARSGRFTIEEMEVRAVRERTLWKWARAGLAMATTLWFFLLFQVCGRRNRFASGLLSLVCLAMIVAIIIPKDADVKPQLWGMTYQLGSAPASATHGPDILPGVPQPSHATTPPQAPAGDVVPDASAAVPEVQGQESPQTTSSHAATSPAPYPQGTMRADRSIIVWIKMRLHRFLPLLHVLVFLLPTLAIAWFIGLRPAALIGCSFAIASEATQSLFGDVWDARDQIDLLLNLSGVAMGLIIFHYAHCLLFKRSTESTSQQ